jgi:hypothetical protein
MTGGMGTPLESKMGMIVIGSVDSGRVRSPSTGGAATFVGVPVVTVAEIVGGTSLTFAPAAVEEVVEVALPFAPAVVEVVAEVVEAVGVGEVVAAVAEVVGDVLASTPHPPVPTGRVFLARVTASTRWNSARSVAFLKAIALEITISLEGLNNSGA